MKFQWRLSLLAIFTAAFISGCSTPVSMPQTGVSPSAQQQDKATELLKLAETSRPIKAAELRAQAARILLSLNKRAEAEQVLSQIDTSLLPPSLRFDIAKLKATALINQNQPDQALSELKQLEQISPETPSDEQKRTLLQLRADALHLKNDAFGEAQQLIQLSLMSEDQDSRQALHDQIWSRLMMLDSGYRSQLLQSGMNSYYEQGWLELANELSNNQQLDTQNQAINNWAMLWESHPARNLLPSALQGLGQDTLNAQKIAVLLPFSGDLARPANAIKEGLLMAHLRRPVGSSNPELLFLDSTKINTPIQLASIIQEQQLDLIIGPLNKDLVAALATDQHISIPILALNYTENLSREGLYQFGLSAEDEATQIADKLYQSGARNAAILTPESSWGIRIEEAFSNRFNTLGGNTVSRGTFGDTSTFSSRVSQFLSTDKSQARATALKQLLGNYKIEFEEHRRHDIDAIVLTALPNDARQLKPILAFNFAGDLPIYATSHVYGGNSDPVLDQDLNGVQFLETPWSIAPPSQDKVLLSQDRPDTNSRFGRLYALGLDAYRIYPYLQQLSAVPGTEISGETGRLSINQQGLIVRKLQWAKYQDGIPQPIE